MALFLITDNCVFIHIPKCGGTSVRSAFFKKKKIKYELPPSWVEHWKFSIVRNPYARIVSAWKMFTIGIDKTVTRPPKKLLEDKSFGNFLNIVTKSNASFFGGGLDGKIRLHTRPITDKFYLINLADYICKIEEIDKNWKHICQKIGVEYSPLPRTHTTPETDNPFCKKTLDIVNDFYEEDFKMYDYSRRSDPNNCLLSEKK